MTYPKPLPIETIKQLLDDFSSHHGSIELDLELINCIAGGWGGGSKKDNLDLRDGLVEICEQIEENWSSL